MTEPHTFNSLDVVGNEKANQLHQCFRSLGVNFATGVPCGVLRHIIKNLSDDKAITHLVANRESEAVGIAAGAYFAGKIPVVYMQNSGLFGASNDIASLLVPYKIPIFFIVTYRGCEGEDAIQHLTTGRATESLIRSFGLTYVVYAGENFEELIPKMFRQMQQETTPIFLLLKRGWQR